MEQIIQAIQNYYASEVAKLIKANAMLAQENQELKERLEKKNETPSSV